METEWKAHLSEERYKAAAELFERLKASLSTEEVLRLKAEAQYSDGVIGEEIIALQAAVQDEAQDADTLEGLYALLLLDCAALRMLEPARKVFAEAIEKVGERPSLFRAFGSTLARLDHRIEARDHLERALELASDDPDTVLALARLQFTLGEFADAEQNARTLSEVPVAAHRAGAARVLASIASVRADFGAEEAAWKCVIEAVPESDHLAWHYMALAMTQVVQGRSDDAFLTYQKAWRCGPGTRTGRHAKRRMRTLTSGDDTKQVRLEAFPTTEQKHNYCGPAVLELCFRYLGVELYQDEIASLIKRDRGTPIYEMYTFLRDKKIEARRVVATSEQIRKAIDLGLPMIVQEEYATTSHVAVVIGYDTGLEAFVVQDPATHRTLYKSFGWSDAAGDVFGHGGLLVVGRSGECEALLKKCDEAGLREAPHLVLVDECDRRQSGVDGNLGEASALEVVRLCKEALSIEPGFKLAQLRMARAYLALLRSDQSWLSETESAVFEARLSNRREVWGHRLQGDLLYETERYREAEAAYTRALAISPDDATSRARMGQCAWSVGDLKEAHKHLMRALEQESDHLYAARTLGLVLARQVWEDPNVSPDGISPLMRHFRYPERITEEVEGSLDTLATRARFWLDYAQAESEDDLYVDVALGGLALRSGDWSEAKGRFEAILERQPRYGLARQGLAEATYRLGDADAALDVLAALCEEAPGVAPYRLRHAEFLRAAKRGAEAANTLWAGLRHNLDAVDALLSPLFNALEAEGNGEVAAAQLREFATDHIGHTNLVREIAIRLVHERQNGHAIALLRHVVQERPSDVEATFELGSILTQLTDTVEEGAGYLERVVESVPYWNKARAILGHAYRKVNLERGLEVLNACRQEDEDAWIWEAKAALHLEKGDLDTADALLERAAASMGDRRYGLGVLAYRNIYDGRYERAIELSQKLEFEDVLDLGDEFVTRIWIYARSHDDLGGDQETLAKIRDAGLLQSSLVASQVHNMTRSSAPSIALEAAESVLRQEDNPDARKRWEIYIATMQAKLDEPGPLEALTASTSESGQYWSRVAWAFSSLDDNKRFAEYAERAYSLDPQNAEVLAAIEGACAAQGDVERALHYAHKLVEHHPYEHQGPERLGMLYAKLGDGDAAMKWSAKAVDAAPYCHISHLSRALAAFAVGDLELCERHLTRTINMHAPETDDDDAHLLRCSLDGDLSGLESGLVALDAKAGAASWPVYKSALRTLAAHRQPCS